MEKQAKTALIIGISGQDGGYLAKYLLHQGYTVVGTSRDATVSSFANLTKLGIRHRVAVDSVSLNDFRSIIHVLKKYEPDEIYNLSGQSSVGLSFDQPVETFESNGTGVLYLLEAIRLLCLPAKLYNAGSSECFGNTNGVPADENTAFNPRSPYAVAKSAAFWTVANYREAYSLFACSGILFNHESPLRPERFVTKKIVSTAVRIANGSTEKLALGNISILRDWGWAPEYVVAMWRMLQHSQPGDYVVATGETRSLEEFVRITFSILGLNWEKHVVFCHDLMRPTEIQMSVGNPSKAKEILDWQVQYRMEDVVELMVADEQSVLNP